MDGWLDTVKEREDKYHRYICTVPKYSMVWYGMVWYHTIVGLDYFF